MQDDKEPQGNPWMKSVMIWSAILLAMLFVAQMFGGAAQQAGAPLAYSEFRAKVQDGAVKDVVLSDDRVSGTLANGERFTANVVRDPELLKLLNDKGVKYDGKPQETPNFWMYLLFQSLPFLLILGIAFFVFRQVQKNNGSGAMGFGKSRAKMLTEKQGRVTFDDVAGIDEAREELEEIVEFLKDPTKFSKLGGQIPKGALLVGSPGTGKTLLARAIAGEAGVPFFTISGSDFVEMFVGVGASRVRDLFQQARAQAPAIVFIDELDALGRARGVDMPGGGHDEKEQTLNQLLAEMDGFDPSVGIIVLAATNRPEILDPALLRAGRFDRQVLVDRPDRQGRIDILNVHLKKISVAPELDVAAVAALTPGFTGADLANLVNEAALVATRRGASATVLDDFTQAVERIVAGLEKKSRILIPRERQIVANHEMGHALVAMALPQTDVVQKVSIIPRGIAALGYTLQRPTEDRFLMSQSELQDRMAVLLGGRAAESLVFDEISTGAADDLVKATDIARNMVVRFGMSKELGQVAYEPETGSFLVGQTPVWRPRTYSDETAEAIDHMVKDLIDSAFQKARAILERNRSVLDTSARELLARETLGPDELAKLTTGLEREAPRKPGLALVE